MSVGFIFAHRAVQAAIRNAPPIEEAQTDWNELNNITKITGTELTKEGYWPAVQILKWKNHHAVDVKTILVIKQDGKLYEEVHRFSAKEGNAIGDLKRQVQRAILNAPVRPVENSVFYKEHTCTDKCYHSIHEVILTGKQYYYRHNNMNQITEMDLKFKFDEDGFGKFERDI